MDEVKIDEKYTFRFVDGSVEILRNGQPWLGADGASFEGDKAWISAACTIEQLRAENVTLQDEVKELLDRE